MTRYAIVMLTTLLLSACGMAETAATGASVAASEAESARQAQASENSSWKARCRPTGGGGATRSRTLLPQLTRRHSSPARASSCRRDVCADCA